MLDGRTSAGHRRRRPWRRPAARPTDFHRLWLGETVSLTGSQLSSFALPLVAIEQCHASAGQLGLLGAARWGPYLLAAIPAGALVDRHPRRPVLIAADLGQAAALACVPLLAVLGSLHFGLLLVIAFLTGACSLVFEVAYRAYLPTLVDRGSLTAANGRLSTSESAAEVVGPSLGGLVVQSAGGPLALLLDAVSFLASAAGLLAIRAREAAIPKRPARALRAEVTEGLRATAGDARLRAFAGEAATYNFCWQIVESVLALYVVRELGVSVATFGLILGCGSVGAVLGALGTARVAARAGLGATIVAASVVGSAAPIAIPAVHGHGALALGCLGLAFFVRGIGVVGCNVHVTSIRQAITPAGLSGRVNASYRFVTAGVVPLGSLAGGALGEGPGLRAALLVGTTGLLGASLWLILSPVRGVRHIDELAAVRSAEISDPGSLVSSSS